MKADFNVRERIDWIGVLDEETLAAKDKAALFLGEQGGYSWEKRA